MKDVKTQDLWLMQGDCLERMKEIPDGSADMVLTDPPYNITACKWDSIIPLEPMWGQLKRVIKPNGAIVMTASQPFTSVLVCSNLGMFKYQWVWEKSKASNFLLARKQPLKAHEDKIFWFFLKIQQFITHKKQLESLLRVKVDLRRDQTLKLLITFRILLSGMTIKETDFQEVFNILKRQNLRRLVRYTQHKNPLLLWNI